MQCNLHSRVTRHNLAAEKEWPSPCMGPCLGRHSPFRRYGASSRNRYHLQGIARPLNSPLNVNQLAANRANAAPVAGDKQRLPFPPLRRRSNGSALLPSSWLPASKARRPATRFGSPWLGGPTATMLHPGASRPRCLSGRGRASQELQLIPEPGLRFLTASRKGARRAHVERMKRVGSSIPR